MLGELQEVQVRPWSIVLHVSTDQGKIYFKAAPPNAKYEMAVVEQLATWFPACVPQVLATQGNQGWWLARDGGESIRINLKATNDLGEWTRALALYAKIQMQLADRTDGLIALGAPDRRLRSLPAKFASLLEDTAILRIDLPKGLTQEELTRLRALTVPLQAWCDQLENSKIPNSLHHGDLNSGNIVKRGEQYGFTDWGDCSIAHPFSSLRTAFVSVEIVLDLPENDASTAPLRDAYLQAWTQFDSLENIKITFEIAYHLSSLVSALSWSSAISLMSEAMRIDYAHVVPELLKEFLNAELDQYPFV